MAINVTQCLMITNCISYSDFTVMLITTVILPVMCMSQVMTEGNPDFIVMIFTIWSGVMQLKKEKLSVLSSYIYGNNS